MKKLLTISGILALFLSTGYSATYTWTGAVDSDWNKPGNWTPAGTPAATDDVVITNAGAGPVLQNNASVVNISIGSGTLNLNGFSLTFTTAGTFTGGTVSNGTLIKTTGNTAVSFTGTVFNCNLEITGGQVTVQSTSFTGKTQISADRFVEITGSTFGDDVADTIRLTKINNTTADAVSGGNTFNGITIIQHSTGNSFRLANTARDIFNEDVTFVSLVSVLDVAYNDAANPTEFRKNVRVTTAGGTVAFSAGTGSSVISSGYALINGADPITGGTVTVNKMIQNGTAANTIAVSAGFILSLNITKSVFDGDINANTGTAGGAIVNLDSSNFNRSASFIAGNFYQVRGCKFGSGAAHTIRLEKFSNENNTWAGDNTFAGTTEIKNNSTRFVRLADVTRDVFNEDVTFSASNGSLQVAYGDAVNPTEFRKNLRFIVTGGSVFLSSSSATIGSTGSSIIASGYGILSGSSPSTSGIVRVNKLTRLTPGFDSLVLGGTAHLYLTNSTLAGVVKLTSGEMTVSNSVFQNKTELTAGIVREISNCQFNTLSPSTDSTFITKTGGANNNTYSLTGSNVFNGVTTITNSSNNGNVIMRLASSAGDEFKRDLILRNTGTGIIDVASGGTTLFQGNVFVNATSGIAIRFGQLGGSSILAAGKTITNVAPGAYTFSAGTLLINGLTQTGGAPSNVQLNLTGSANLTLQNSTITDNFTGACLGNTTVNNCVFDKDFHLSSLNLALTGNRTNISTGTSIITKSNEGSNNTANGGNNFKGITTVTFNNTVNSNTRTLDFGVTNPDTFQTNLTVNAAGRGNIRLATSSVNNLFNGTTTLNVSSVANALINFCFDAGSQASFNGNIELNNAGAGTRILFGNTGTGGNSTLAAGRTIAQGSTGVSNGAVSVYNFTQQGTTAQNIIFSGTGNLIIGTGTTFNGPVDFRSPQLLLHGATFNGATSYFEKTGASNNSSNGGNTFNSITTFANTGAGIMTLANVTGDQFLNNVTLAGGTGIIQIATNGTNVFERNISVEKTNVVWNYDTGITELGASTPGAIGIVAPATSPLSIKNLRLNKTGSFATLATNVTVTNSLDLAVGYINLNGNRLLLDNTNVASLTRTSGFLVSESTDNSGQFLRRLAAGATGALLFPFGKTDGTYLPLTVEYTTATTTATTIRAATYGTGANNLPWPATVTNLTSVYIADNNANVVDRFWQIDRTVGTGGEATVTFTYDENEIPANGEETMVAQRWSDVAPAGWVLPLAGQAQNTVLNTVTVPGVSAFSPWTLVRDEFILPLHILSFTAHNSGEGVVLAWSVVETGSELLYVPERSLDGVEFEALAEIEPYASRGPAGYKFVDTYFNQKSYYRLKLIDVDGAVSYSSIISVTDVGGGNKFTVFPNPMAGNELTIVFEKPGFNPEYAVIIDLSGRAVYTHTFSGGVENLYSFTVQRQLNEGMYLLRLYSDNEVLQQKIQKLK